MRNETLHHPEWPQILLDLVEILVEFVLIPVTLPVSIHISITAIANRVIKNKRQDYPRHTHTIQEKECPRKISNKDFKKQKINYIH